MSSMLNWDQPEGHRESKGLFTRCALHRKQDLFLGKEPEPSFKFHSKAGLWREAPYTSPRPNSAPALALGSARQHPGPRGRSLFRPQSGPVQAPPWYGRLRCQRQTRAQCSLYQDKVFKPFLTREVALHSYNHPPRPDHEYPSSSS